MKLLDRFMTSTIDNRIIWKIYDKETHKKLCDDYGALRGDSPLDSMSVWSMAIKTAANGIKYLRVSVYRPISFNWKGAQQ